LYNKELKMNFKQIVKEVLLTEAKELEKAASSISFDIENIDLL
jgi:arabinose-5-phosphate isomerase